jgi:hypothetical protein
MENGDEMGNSLVEIACGVGRPAGEQGPGAARTVGNIYELDDGIGRRINNRRKCGFITFGLFVSYNSLACLGQG